MKQYLPSFQLILLNCLPFLSFLFHISSIVTATQLHEFSLKLQFDFHNLFVGFPVYSVEKRGPLLSIRDTIILHLCLFAFVVEASASSPPFLLHV